MAIIGVAERDALWTDYACKKHRTKRVFWGSFYTVWHWLARWWKIKPQLGVLQALYVLTLIATAVLGSVAAVEKFKGTGATTRPSAGGVWSETLAWMQAWSPILLPAGVVIGLWYKTATTRAAAPHEMERRRSVSSLLAHLTHSDAVDRERLGDQSEARLIEVCECVRRDVEEYLQLGESDVEILLLRHIAVAGDEHGGTLAAIARDRPTDTGFFNRTLHPCLEAFVYESVRLRRSVAFHDLRGGLFRKCYGKVKADYRSVACIPITRPGDAIPYGVLTVKLKYPYLLWPKKDVKLERRLSMYVEVVNVFCPEE
jgi:hypothetical protein